MRGQTVIPINIPVDASLESFSSVRNRELVSELEMLIAGSRDKRIIYIWGETGAGKSHLLTVCGQLWGADQSVYVSGLQPMDSELTDRIPENALVCVDDVHKLAGNVLYQQIVLGVYEKVISGTGAFIASSRSPVDPMDLELKDLSSRLSIGGVFNLHALDDSEKSELLISQGQKRGFTLDQKVADFIMSHCSRDTRSLFALLDKLDSASLKEKRKITIPFVKSVLDQEQT